MEAGEGPGRTSSRTQGKGSKDFPHNADVGQALAVAARMNQQHTPW